MRLSSGNHLINDKKHGNRQADGGGQSSHMRIMAKNVGDG
jgi:hypothetical protein